MKILFVFLSLFIFSCSLTYSDEKLYPNASMEVLSRESAGYGIFERVVLKDGNLIDTVMLPIESGTYFNDNDGYLIPNYGSVCKCRPRVVAAIYFKNNQ